MKFYFLTLTVSLMALIFTSESKALDLMQELSACVDSSPTDHLFQIVQSGICREEETGGLASIHAQSEALSLTALKTLGFEEFQHSLYLHALENGALTYATQLAQQKPLHEIDYTKIANDLCNQGRDQRHWCDPKDRAELLNFLRLKKNEIQSTQVETDQGIFDQLNGKHKGVGIIGEIEGLRNQVKIPAILHNSPYFTPNWDDPNSIQALDRYQASFLKLTSNYPGLLLYTDTLRQTFGDLRDVGDAERCLDCPGPLTYKLPPHHPIHSVDQIAQARQEVLTKVKDEFRFLNQNRTPSLSNIEKLVDSNPVALGETLVHYPDYLPMACYQINKNIRDHKNGKELADVAFWGSVVVGAAVTGGVGGPLILAGAVLEGSGVGATLQDGLTANLEGHQAKAEDLGATGDESSAAHEDAIRARNVANAANARFKWEAAGATVGFIVPAAAYVGRAAVKEIVAQKLKVDALSSLDTAEDEPSTLTPENALHSEITSPIRRREPWYTQKIEAGKFRAHTFFEGDQKGTVFMDELKGGVFPESSPTEIHALEALLSQIELNASQLDMKNKAAVASFNRQAIEAASALLEARRVPHSIYKNERGDAVIEVLDYRSNPIGRYVDSAQNTGLVVRVQFDPLYLRKSDSKGTFFPDDQTHLLSYDDILDGNVAGKTATHEIKHAFNNGSTGHAKITGGPGTLPGAFERYAHFLSFDELNTYSLNLRQSFVEYRTAAIKWTKPPKTMNGKIIKAREPSFIRFMHKTGLKSDINYLRGLAERSEAIADQMLEVLKKGADDSASRFIYEPKDADSPFSFGRVKFEEESNRPVAVVYLCQKDDSTMEVSIPLNIKKLSLNNAKNRKILRQAVETLKKTAQERLEFAHEAEVAAWRADYASTTQERIEILNELRASQVWQDSLK